MDNLLILEWLIFKGAVEEHESKMLFATKKENRAEKQLFKISVSSCVILITAAKSGWEIAKFRNFAICWD